MKCRKVKRLISLYVDGEISPAKKLKMMAHLEGCDACQKEKDTLEYMNRLLVPSVPLQPSPQFLLKLKRRIIAAETRGSFAAAWLDYLKPALAGMACVLVFLLFFLLGNSLGTKLVEKPAPEPTAKVTVKETFNSTMNITVFDDMPRDSLASVYFAVLQDRKNEN